MARSIQKLTDTGLRALKAIGRHSDGGGLYLNVTATGTRSWLFMWANGGKRREMGLGAYPSISLAKARARAAELREAVAAGRDPIAEKRQAPEPTFGECVSDYITANEAGWTNEKHRYQWGQTLGDAYCAELRKKRVSEITTADVEKVLRPIWNSKQETASRLRGRIERVLDYAKTKGWRQGENPAMWRGNLAHVLPKTKAAVIHQPALPYDEVPAFMQALANREGLSARALELTILTAARSGEMLGATWAEFDLNGALWIVPGERMKLKVMHEVPLSDAAVAILKKLKETATSDYLFPSSTKKGKPLSNMSMLMLLRRMGRADISVHGFRSSFRDWAGDKANVEREVAEAALAHQVGNEVERAYRRGTALAKRRILMQRWADYCFSMGMTGENNVVPFGGNRAPAA